MSTTTTLRTPTSFRLDASLLSLLKEKAKENHKSLNKYVESILMDVLQYSKPKAKTQTRIRLEKRIQEIKDLPANWDSESALSISPRVCSITSTILKKCDENQIQHLAIFPNRSGNIFMQWETDKGDACLAVTKDSLSYNVCAGENDSYGKLSLHDEKIFLDELNKIL